MGQGSPASSASPLSSILSSISDITSKQLVLVLDLFCSIMLVCHIVKKNMHLPQVMCVGFFFSFAILVSFYISNKSSSEFVKK